jgi:NAD(P)H dehydrogenase (quinone)
MPQAERVAVVGAAGRTGLRILSALRASGFAPRAVTRREQQADAVLAAGAAETETADYASVAELTVALDGIDRVVIVPPSYSPEDVYIANTAVAASAAGVAHIVLHSVLHPHTPSMRHHMRKAAGEAVVRDGDVPWTILQPSMYAQTVLLFSDRSPEGRICAPFDVDARFTVVDLEDIAEVTALVLRGDDHFYASYELVGNPPVSCREMLRVVAKLRGVTAEPERIHPWELKLPDWLSDNMGAFAAMCEEYTAHGLLGNANVTRMLLGREPTRFAEVARRELAGCRSRC